MAFVGIAALIGLILSNVAFFLMFKSWLIALVANHTSVEEECVTAVDVCDMSIFDIGCVRGFGKKPHEVGEQSRG